MPFNQQVHISGNQHLRISQRDGWGAIREHYARAGADRKVGLVLPVGCGKSGLITLTPFAIQARRALVIAPGTKTAISWPPTYVPVAIQISMSAAACCRPLRTSRKSQ